MGVVVSAGVVAVKAHSNTAKAALALAARQRGKEFTVGSSKDLHYHLI